MKICYIIKYIRDYNREIIFCKLFPILFNKTRLYSIDDIKVYNFHHFALDTREDYNLLFIQAYFFFTFSHRFRPKDLQKGSLKVKIEQINRDNR